MNTITVITELCAEDRARLDAIIAALQSHPGKPAEPDTTAAQEPVVSEQQFNHDDILKKVIALSATGKKQEAREIVNAYAAKVSDIPVDKLAEIAERLDAIGV